MACKLWTAEVASEPPLLKLAMDVGAKSTALWETTPSLPSGPNDILPRPLASLLVSFLSAIESEAVLAATPCAP